jgi:hypothetical protein
MKTSEAKRLSYSTKFLLRSLRKSTVDSKSFELLEKKILGELNNFSIEKKSQKIHSLKLTLEINPVVAKFKPMSNMILFREILKTRGQLRWLTNRFFTPVLHSSYDITRGKLLLLIIFNWHLFSREVLSRLRFKDIDARMHQQIPLEAYSNPNFEINLNQNGLNILEGEYNNKLRYSVTNSEYLQKYTIGKIILWDSRCASSLIWRSEKLKSSPNLYLFLERLQDFILPKDLFPPTIVKVHPNARDTLDQRLLKSNIRRADSVENVQIWHRRFIISNGEWLLIDETCSPKLDFVAGQWQYLSDFEIDSETVEIKKPNSDNFVMIPEAIFLMGRADENWYHLLLDTLPRYLFFAALNPEIPVLIRADLPKTSLDILHRLIARKIILVEPKETISVGLLHYIAARSTVFDSKTKDNQELVLFSPLILADLREWILDCLTKDESLIFPLKIYIERSAKYRNVINENSLMVKLKTMGFQVIKCTEDFYLNQAHYFEGAEHIVAPGGAVLANILFMNEGSRVTVIRSSRNSELELWRKLAIACGVELKEVLGIPSYHGLKILSRMHSNYFVPIWKLNSIAKGNIK